jgi:RNA polymerase sigma factor, sigma-70 family
MNHLETEKAFIELIQQNERLIYKVCSVYTSEALPIADLFQEVVYNLWKGYAKFRNECSISTWMYRIALNTCISGLRKETKRPIHIPINQLAEQLVEPESFCENIKEMYRLIRRLKTLERAIVLLYLEEKSYQEIADITGLTVSNVAVKLNRIKEKLKTMSKN